MGHQHNSCSSSSRWHFLAPHHLKNLMNAVKWPTMHLKKMKFQPHGRREQSGYECTLDHPRPIECFNPLKSGVMEHSEHR